MIGVLLVWFFYFLGRYLEYIGKFNEECRFVKGMVFSYVYFEFLFYILGCIYEMLCLYFMGWSFWCSVLEEDKIDDFRIEKGVIMVCFFYIVYCYLDFWSVLEIFNLSCDFSSSMGYIYFFFGLGLWWCVGENFVMVELMMIVFMIFRYFRFFVFFGFEV